MLRPLALALLLAGCADGGMPAPDAGAALAWPDSTYPDGSRVLPLTTRPAPEPEPPPPAHLTVSPGALAAVDTTTQPGAGLFQYVGVYHGGEAPASDGERWLGLYPTRTGWELAPVTVRARAAPDPVMWTSDGPEDPPTGVEITTDRTTRRAQDWLRDDGLVFLRADALSPGPVATAFAGAWPLRAGVHLAVTLPGREPARLEVLYVAGRAHESVLTLDGAPIVHLHDRDAGHPTLLWAGDLDRDGALDLVLDASPHYNATVLQLWLSSAAGGGAPLGLVAEHEATGC